MATFTPPVVSDVPPFDVDATGPAYRLARHMGTRQRGVNVYKLNDGSYVQDTATAENANTSVPYPIDLDNPGSPFVSWWDPVTNGPKSVSPSKWVVGIYYGGHSYGVSTAEAAALTAAGYGGRIT